MIGKMEIQRLREQAQSALGLRFDVREFHDVVLRNGDLPLVLLRREVERWLAEATAREDPPRPSRSRDSGASG